MNRRTYDHPLAFGTLFCMGCLCLATGKWSPVFADDVSIVQPFVGEKTLIVVRVDPKGLELPDFPEDVKSTFPRGQQALDRWVQDVKSGLEKVRMAAGDQEIFATIGIPLSPADRPVFLFAKETPKSRAKRDALMDAWKISSLSRDGLTIIGLDDRLESRLQQNIAAPREALADAFDAVSEYPIQILLLPPDHVRRAVSELMPRLPRQLGGGPSSVLTDGLVWAAFGMDPDPGRMVLIAQSRSAQAAKSLTTQVPAMLLALYNENAALHAKLPRDAVQALLASIHGSVQGDRVIVRFDETQLISTAMRVLAEAPETLAERIRRQTNAKRFRQILLAMHNYHDVYKMFPPRNEERGDDGKPHLSWRVHMLPFLGQQALYQQFAVDEPWNSPHNKPLIKKMPAVYGGRSVGIEAGHTTFLAPVGEGTIFGGDKGTSIGKIHDGTSNTIAIVEVKPDRSVPWTQPRDYPFDPRQPASGLRADGNEQFLAAFADGSVHWMPVKMPTKIFLRLFQMSDGESIDWDVIR